MIQALYQELANLSSSGQPAVLCTIVHSSGSTPRHAGSKMIVYPTRQILGTVGGGELEERVIAEAMLALKDGKCRLLKYEMTDTNRGDPGICGGQVEIFVEPILPPSMIIIIGLGHVGKAVAHLAKWLGFRVAVSDDRPELCTPEACPTADMYYPVQMQELTDQVEITPQSYIILTTRGVDVDVPGLPALLQSKAGYIGIIGSRRRWAETRKALIKEGVNKDDLERIHSPIGLGIGAETPEEIAVSILAQIIMLREGGSGKPMKESG